jgi:hypothetical protein
MVKKDKQLTNFIFSTDSLKRSASHADETDHVAGAGEKAMPVQEAEASTSGTLYPPSVSHKKGYLEVSSLHTIYYEVFGNPKGRPVVCEFCLLLHHFSNPLQLARELLFRGFYIVSVSF